MNFAQMTCGWQPGRSLVALLLALRGRGDQRFALPEGGDGCWRDL